MTLDTHHARTLRRGASILPFEMAQSAPSTPIVILTCWVQSVRERVMKHCRLVFTVVALGLLPVLQLPGLSAADDITVLCSNGLKAVAEDLIPKFERESKHHVVVKYGLASMLKQQIEGGEAFDVALVTPTVIDD